MFYMQFFKVVHNNYSRDIFLIAMITLIDFQQCGETLIGEQILIGIFTMEWVHVLLQTLKLYILRFARRQL